MFRLKGCPRCRGDLLLERDHDGSYEQCIQCGYNLYLIPATAKAVKKNVPNATVEDKGNNPGTSRFTKPMLQKIAGLP